MKATLVLLFVGISCFSIAYALEPTESAPDIQDTLQQLERDVAALESIIAAQSRTIRAQAKLIEDLQGGVAPPVDPPPVDPPPPTTGPGMDGAPVRIDPVRPIRIDAHVYAGRYEINGRSYPGMARDAYEAVDEAKRGEGVIVLGIHGDVGRVSLGHAYSKWSDDIFRDKDDIGVQVVMIGLDDAAAVGPIFLGSRDNDAGNFDPCDSASFFDLGVKGESGTYAFRQHGYCREIVFDRIWIKPNPSTQGMAVPYLSAFLFHQDWERMTLKGYEPRGLALGEHVAYIKGGGFTQVLDCNLFGGRRTGFQDRSHQDSPYPSPPRHGDFIADGNWAEGFGFNHVNASGGQWMTVWYSGEYKVRISNNRCIDARYGCLGISKGVSSSEPYLTDDGWSHSNVYIWGNVFENKRASRACVSLTDVRDRIHFGTGNDFTGPTQGSYTMTFGNQWGYKQAGAQNPTAWTFYNELPTWPVHEYMPSTDSFRLLTADELAGTQVGR